jgi:hypothetical protein
VFGGLRHRLKHLVVALVGLAVAAAGSPAAGAPVLTVTDVAGVAGLGQTTSTYSAVFSDVNGDGVRDVLLNRHFQRPMQLFHGNADGTFTLAASFAQTDRHGCGTADVNGDGRVDIYCAEGASTVAGSIVKSNDLLMQQSDGAFVDGAQAMGVDDPYGRGRDVTFLNANGDVYPDLFVGNVGGRTDGKPSHNRLFLNDGGAGFHDSGDPDITSTTGAHCAIPRDVNGDGWTDLLVCSAGKTGGPLHLYRNDEGKGFTDVSASAGLRGVALGAEILDLNRDGRLDILSVDPTGVHIQLATAPARFGPPRALPGVQGGVDLAVADVEGDGDVDVYVVRGCAGGHDLGDTLLLNAGRGSFTSMAIAPAPGGCGDAVVRMAYRSRPGFLVLNGHSKAEGPIQLLTFSR